MFAVLVGVLRRRRAKAVAVSIAVATTALVGVVVVMLGVPSRGAGTAEADGRDLGADESLYQQPELPRAAVTRPSERPNIVFVLTDDLSTNLLPFMPHVQALRERGMTFTRYFVTNSLCCPSRATTLTGGYPHTTGVLTNGGEDGGYPEFHYRQDDRETFATSLRKAGYTTAFMGKYLNGYRAAPPGVGAAAAVAPGWDEWYVPGDHDGYSGFDYLMNENGRLLRYGHESTDYFTDVMSDKGTGFIRRAAVSGSPFMLEVSTFAPHEPFTPAPRHADAYPGLVQPRTPAYNAPATAGEPRWLAARKPLPPDQLTWYDKIYRKRAQSARGVDDLVAALTDTLRANGLLENTYFVFSSDNGYHLGEHRLPAGKMTPFDTDIRVPLVVAGPGVAAGSTNDELVANIDLCPTFEDLGGAATTPLVDGRSLVPLLHGQPTGGWRDAVLIEHKRPVTSAEAGPDQEAAVLNPPSYAALRMRGALYVEYEDGDRAYYDLAKDPAELHNVVGQLGAAKRTALSRRVAQARACHGAASCSGAGAHRTTAAH